MYQISTFYTLNLHHVVCWFYIHPCGVLILHSPMWCADFTFTDLENRNRDRQEHCQPLGTGESSVQLAGRGKSRSHPGAQRDVSTLHQADRTTSELRGCPPMTEGPGPLRGQGTAWPEQQNPCSPPNPVSTGSMAHRLQETDQPRVKGEDTAGTRKRIQTSPHPKHPDC